MKKSTNSHIEKNQCLTCKRPKAKKLRISLSKYNLEPMIVSESKNTAIILAGGSGSRMRGLVKDKVLEPLLGLPVLFHSFKAFLESSQVEEVVFVCRDSVQENRIKKSLKKYFPKVNNCINIKYTLGGAQRQDSVLNGLAEVSDKSALAFIHDGARPMVRPESIALLTAAAMRDGASVLASRVVDTIKIVPENKQCENIKLEDMDRSRLWAMQTPQVFVASEILSAYEYVSKNEIAITDDVAAYVIADKKISIVENLYPNPKITVPEDIAYIEFLESRKKK